MRPFMLTLLAALATLLAFSRPAVAASPSMSQATSVAQESAESDKDDSDDDDDDDEGGEGGW